MPRSTFLHHEGEVADVCINISSKDVEYSASESFFFFFVWNIEFVYDGHQILIVPGIGIHCGKRLGVNLLAILPVISLRKEMLVTINWNQFWWHHSDSCHCCKSIVCHLDLCERVIVFLGEFKQVIGIIRRQHDLAGTNFAGFVVPRNDGFGMLASCWCSYFI